MSELRWNPLLGEWLVTATHRQDRTFLPPKDFCPLCPTKPGAFETEVPEPTYDLVVFENRFPSFQPHPPEPAVKGSELYPVYPAKGICEVVLYTPEHNSTLADQPVERLVKLVKIWKERFESLDTIDFVKYVFIFENKGEAIGVTLNHPHGQIYAYPFIPPKIERELSQSEEYWSKNQHCLLCDVREDEVREEKRVIVANASFTAYIPFFARWPYEVHISSNRHLQAISDLTKEEEIDLAEILKQLLVAYDGLFGFSLPYMMVMHQRPSDGGTYEHYHFHIEFYPPLRTATRLKYLAGSETGAGAFINDSLPEEKAVELRSHITPVKWGSANYG